RNRQIDPQVAAVDLEERMRGDVDGDQEIAGRMTGGGFALAAQAYLLALGDARWNLDIELLAVGQADALLAALHRLLQRHRHRDADIQIEADAARLKLKRAACARATTARAACLSAAEHAVEDVLEAAGAAAGAEAAPRTGAEGVALEAARTRAAATAA